jgi:CubicO group peptidase (beta-lactamase class C family)
MPHDVRSISKSVVSLLFGIALDQGLIASVDDPVHIYFPEYAALRTPAKDHILLRHLLAMTSGIEWNESRSPYHDPKNSEVMMSHSTDPYHFVLEQPVGAEAGRVWNYNGGGTQLLAGVLQRKTGKSLVEFANEVLFGPLGITKFEWTKMPANGELAAASGLRLRPRDMAKIGEIVLRKGIWNGHRVVSGSWVEQSIRAGPDERTLYGYQWWIGSAAVGDQATSWIAGIGLGGQRIYIIPAYDLVVVITAGLYVDPLEDQIRVIDSIFDHVLAAVRH